MKRVLLSWSSGKDSAWALHMLRQQPDVEVCGLLTTFNESNHRVAMHAIRQELVQAQAMAAGLPLWAVPLPYPCPNEVYEARIRAALERARGENITHVAFGDLFLEDIRAYREQMMADSGLQPLFPLWCSANQTPALARQMLQHGLCAVLVTIDPQQLSPAFAGRRYDAQLLSDLPPHVDPCGERGEFHTFCFAGPMFRHPIRFQIGQNLQRDGFHFTDLIPL
ncbi:MAG: ATP-binding protein [Anaerolineae bacterium]|nr:MAG: ATP-binding protein [Anaerolineae bacterium]